jgi:hypothetical protein
MEDVTMEIGVEGVIDDFNAVSPEYVLQLDMSEAEIEDILRSPPHDEVGEAEILDLSLNDKDDRKRQADNMDEHVETNTGPKRHKITAITRDVMWGQTETNGWTKELEKTLRKDDSYQNRFRPIGGQKAKKIRLSREINSELVKIKLYCQRQEKEIKRLQAWWKNMSVLTTKQQERLRTSLQAEQEKNREIKDLKIQNMLVEPIQYKKKGNNATEPVRYRTKDIENM